MSRYSKAAVAAQLAGEPEPPLLSERPTLPPLSSGAPIIERVKFCDHARTGTEKRPIREVHCGQALLSDDPRGVMIDGRILVPWSNIWWIEYR